LPQLQVRAFALAYRFSKMFAGLAKDADSESKNHGQHVASHMFERR
jgi:hypothetical protein